MRALFLLLLLLNLVLFAYARLASEGHAPNELTRLEISPEKIKVLKAYGQNAPERPSPSDAGSKPPAQAAVAAPAACLEWGIFAGPDVTRADTALVRLEVPQDRLERVVTDAGGYWVYIPPLKTRAETDRKIGELKALGITDFFLVQDAGQWRNAVSLGIFRTDEAAQAYLGKLKDRGVRSAVAERRENFLKQIAFLVREPDPATVAKLATLQQEFAGTELKATQCPAPAAAAKS